MLHKTLLAMKRAITSYETRRLRGKILRERNTKQRRILIKEYDQEYGCITLPEAQWLFQTLERWNQYYTYYLLAASTGMRGGELCRLSLRNFNKDFTTITYEVAKPSKRHNEEDILVEKEKVRSVVLDPWVRDELLTYLKRHCTGVGTDGNCCYVTPWSYTDDDGNVVSNKLFSFRDIDITTAYWHKIKKRMRLAGFDVDRLERHTRRDFAGTEKKTYVLRQHMWRHFALVLYYYKNNKDIIQARNWINHSDVAITSNYLHSAHELGSNEDILRTITWEQITGHDMSILELNN